VSQINSKEVMSFGYDNAFRLNTYTNTTVPTASATYQYDLLDHLSSAVTSGGSLGWLYDANGNRTTQTGTAQSMTIAPTSNQVSSITGVRSGSYSYDGAGDTLSYPTTTFTYNNRGRMKTAIVGSSTTTYVYNALGQRTKKSGGVAGTVVNVYDEAGHLLGEYNGTGGLVQETVWLGDIPVAILRPGTPAAIYYVHANQLNAPVAITRPSDNKFRWQWHSDAFGVTKPLLNLRNVGPLIERVCGGGGARGVRTKTIHRDSRLPSVAFDHPVDAGGHKSTFQAGSGGIGANGLEEWRIAVGAMASGVEVFGNRAQCTGLNRDVALFFALAVDPKMLYATAVV
jgi:hypothetical protein